jgi:ligand-binding sensor domain-containing protein
MGTLARRSTRFCLSGVWLAISVIAPPSAQAERLPIKTYTAADGLAHDTVRRIVADSRGFLWFCTVQGLSRFDGQSFVTYGPLEGLPSMSITDLLETPRGVYWVATNGGGVARFNRTDAVSLEGQGHRRPQAPDSPRFTVFSVGDDLQTNRVNALYEDSARRLWAGTDAGLFVLDGTNPDAQFERLALGLDSRPDRAVHVWSFVEDRQGSLWIGTSWGLLRRLPEGQLIHHPIQPIGRTDDARALLTDREGRIWFGHDTGLIALRPEPVTVAVSALNRGGSHCTDLSTR